MIKIIAGLGNEITRSYFWSISASADYPVRRGLRVFPRPIPCPYFERQLTPMILRFGCMWLLAAGGMWHVASWGC